jgi:peptidoglycan endopeptidase LytE
LEFMINSLARSCVMPGEESSFNAVLRPATAFLAEAIRSANLSSKKRLVVGQRLNIPIRSTKSSGPAVKPGRSGKAVSSHQVQKGDTLASLSRKYGITIAEIRKINSLKNDNLKIGQTLQLATKNEGEAQPKERKKAESQGKKKKAVPVTKPVR